MRPAPARTPRSTKKQLIYINGLRIRAGMSFEEYDKFKSDNKVDDQDRRDAGRIIGKLKDLNIELRRPR